MSNIFEYSSPIITELRTDFVPISQVAQIMGGKVILQELPDKYEGVIVSGHDIGWVEVNTSKEILNNLDAYYVDYANRMVYFNSSRELMQVNFEFYGKGLIFQSADSIYTDELNGNVVETLQDVIHEVGNVIGSIDDLNEKIEHAEELEISLESKINTGTSLVTILDDSISDGQALIPDLSSSVNTANTAKQNLVDSISDANSANSDLEDSIDLVNTAKQNLDGSIATGNTLKSELDSSITAGVTLNTNLEDNISSGETLDGELANKISTGTTLDSDLNSSISTANTAKNNLDASIGTANIAKSNLDGSISTGNTLKSVLDDTVATGTALDGNLGTKITTGASLDATLQNTISDAEQINTTLSGSVQSGQNKIDEMDSKIAEADLKIGETETARLSVIATQEKIEVWETYNSGKVYYPLNKVSYGGSSYVCLQETTAGVSPTDGDYWLLVAQRGVDGMGSTSSVNNVSPDANGNVTLTATDVGAETPAGAQVKANAAESAANAELNAHKTDTAQHLEAGERENWNGKANASDVYDKAYMDALSLSMSTLLNNKVDTSHLTEKATTTTLGHVMVDGSTIVVDPSGKISTQVGWSDVGLRPSSPVADIDDSVGKRHTHVNKTVLDAVEEAYTTTEKTKLAGIASGANNYVHPATHPPSIITQDANNRFMTDAERSKLSGIETGAQVNAVNNVAGKTGNVTLVKDDVGLPLVDNVKQATKAEFDSTIGNMSSVPTTSKVVAGAISELFTSVSDATRYGTTTNTGNAYSLTLTPAITAYNESLTVRIKVNADSTGAATLNVDGLGAKALKNAKGEDVKDLIAGSIYTFVYNGVNFILQGEGGGGGAKIKSVQRGISTIAAGTNSIDVPITPVVESNTFALLTYTFGDIIGLIEADKAAVSITLQQNNLIRIRSTTITGSPIVASWEVVEFESGVKVQSGYVNRQPNNTEGTVNVSSIDPSRSFLVFSFTTNMAGTAGQYITNMLIKGRIIDATKIGFQPNVAGSGTGNSVQMRWFLVTFVD